MDIESQIRHANQAIKHAKDVQNTSQKIFFQQYADLKSESLDAILKLGKIMDNVAKTTDKAMRGAKIADKRAKARLVAVKKATSETVKYTARAKRAAITSKKAAESAIITSRKMEKFPKQKEKLHMTYKIQLKAAITAAKESEKNTKLAMKSSKVARAAARIPLEPIKL